MKFSESKIVKVHGLQCDAPNCDYHDDTICADDYEEYLNAPCPECGAPLLTQADLDSLKDMLELEEHLIGLGIPLEVPGEPKFSIPLEMNGTGKIEIGEPKIIK